MSVIEDHLSVDIDFFNPSVKCLSFIWSPAAFAVLVFCLDCEGFVIVEYY